jgi:hypothetical protein
VEQRSDGLAYLPGAAQPFTGEALTPHERQPWRAKLREPYAAGKRNGDLTELFSDGTIKSVRHYADGVPKWTKSFYKGGQLKFSLSLNAADKVEGPYERFHENGKLAATATFDALERWHGEFKEWDAEGNPRAQYDMKEGKLEKIVFETPAKKEERIAQGVFARGETPPPGWAPPAKTAEPAGDK